MFMTLEEYVQALREGSALFYLGDSGVLFDGDAREREAQILRGEIGECPDLRDAKGHDAYASIGYGNVLSGAFCHFWKGQRLVDLVHAIGVWRERREEIRREWKRQNSEWAMGANQERARLMQKVARGKEDERVLQRLSEGHHREFWGMCEDMQEELRAVARDLFERYVPFRFDLEALMSWELMPSKLGYKAAVKFEDYQLVAEESWRRVVCLLYVGGEGECKEMPDPLGRAVADGMVQAWSCMVVGLSKMRADLEGAYKRGSKGVSEEVLGVGMVAGARAGTKRSKVGDKVRVGLLMEPLFHKAEEARPSMGVVQRNLLGHCEMFRFQCGQVRAGMREGVVSLQLVYGAMESAQMMIGALNTYCEWTVKCRFVGESVSSRETAEVHAFRAMGAGLEYDVRCGAGCFLCLHTV